jgi:type IV pilus biogenesis protein CpaD/CtpE
MVTTRNRLAAAAAALAGLLLQGCSTTPRFDHNFGASVRANLAAQVIDPGAAVNANPASGMDGTAALAARERYQHSFKEPEPRPAALFISGGGAN